MFTVWLRSRAAQPLLVAAALALVTVTAVTGLKATGFFFQGEVLAPATVPPVAGLCTAQLASDMGGTVSPLFCSNGDINRLAWRLIATDNPDVMRLGRNPRPADVGEAAARDLRDRMSGSRECSALTLSAAYYGWNFHIDPVTGLSLSCPILK